MERKAVTGLMLTLLLIGMLTLAFNIQPLKAEPTTWTVDDDGPADFSSIQEAINSLDVKDGDAILVKTGTYYENVVVNKKVSLIGEDRDSTVIDGTETDIVVRVRADYVTITNFTIRNSRTSYADDASIHIDGQSHNIIKGNMFADNLVSIYLNNAHNNTICNNEVIAAFQWYTIWLRQSNHNIIEENLITNNRGSGIILWSSNLNTVNGNNVTGIPTLTTRDGMGIVLYSGSYNNVVSNNWLVYNQYSGVSLMESEGNIIQGNIMDRNYLGIYSWKSSNTICRNTVSNNDWYGIYFFQSNISIIYHNNFLNNGICLSQAHGNMWHDGYPSGGNYWSDYTDMDEKSGSDQDLPGSDGIWDHPYVIDENNQDRYPLVEPWSPLPRTVGELKTEIEELGSEGEIDNQGIVKSLIAKLNVAQKLADKEKIDEAKIVLEDFIIQVQELSEIHITVEAANLLIKSAESIVSHLKPLFLTSPKKNLL